MQLGNWLPFCRGAATKTLRGCPTDPSIDPLFFARLLIAALAVLMKAREHVRQLTNRDAGKDVIRPP